MKLIAGVPVGKKGTRTRARRKKTRKTKAIVKEDAEVEYLSCQR